MNFRLKLVLMIVIIGILLIVVFNPTSHTISLAWRNAFAFIAFLIAAIIIFLSEKLRRKSRSS